MLQDRVLSNSELLIFLKHIYTTLESEISFDDIIFIISSCKELKIIYFNIKSGKTIEAELKKNSIAWDALATNRAKISTSKREENNPFNYGISSQIVIPCSTLDTKKCFGAISIRRKSSDFSMEEMQRAEEIIEKIVSLDFSKIEKIARRFAYCLESMSLSKISQELNSNQLREFFSSVIHDIRTPMNAVIGFLELLKEDNLTNTQKEYIATALKSADMVVALINDVLDFNKIVSGNLDIDFHYFSLPDELKNSSLLFYHSARKKQIDLISYFDPNIPYVIKSDPFRIKQIVNNLLSNAIKFTDVGGKIVVEALYNQSKDILNISVKDSGIGIKESALKTIFEPFKQASSDTSLKYGGTGLGLTISKKLANMLGGDLRVQSRVNKGSIFTLTIPCHTIPGTPRYLEYSPEQFPPIYLIEGDESKYRYIKYFKKYFEELNISHKALTYKEFIDIKIEPTALIIATKLNFESKITQDLIKRYHNRLIVLQHKIFTHNSERYKDLFMLEAPIFPDKLFKAIVNFGKEKEETSKEVEKINSNKSVLIVDDNPINRKLLDEVCSRVGAKTYIASDGKEAVEIFKKYLIDLIFIDQNMPILSGTEAIRQIKALPNGANVTIYGLTGDANKETLDEMIRAGADNILTKPIKIKEIQNILTK